MNSLEDKFLGILKASKNTIHRLCCGFAGNTVDAEDYFQEVLLQIWRSLPGFKSASSLNTWVYRIALNVCLQEKQKRERSIKAKQTLFAGPATTINARHDERYEQLYYCIEKLDDTDKSLIMLYLEDMSYKQIGEITGITENHVAVKIKRIRQKLFHCFKRIS